jgi:hypothetical protein
MKRVLVSVALFGVLACSDSSEPGVRGSMSFTYSGGGGGSFNASGDAPVFTAPPPTATSWAVGYMQSGEINIGASSPRSGGRVDLAILRVERTTPGSASIDPACNIDGDIACTGMELSLNFNGNGDTADFFCALTSGTIVLTEVSGSRAKGTVSGNGNCIAGTGGSATDFTVSNGTFDVAVVAPPA